MSADYFIAGRGAGKTYALVEWQQADPANRAIVVANGQRAGWVKQQIIQYRQDRGLGLDGGSLNRWVIGAQEAASRGALNGRTLELAVDDATAVLGTLLHTRGRSHIARIADGGSVVTSQAEWRGR